MTSSAPTAAIDVQHLVKRYQKATSNAVDDISFSVERGEFFALLGPNGAGKTTTISILITMLSPTSGSVRIAGYDLESQSSEVRRHVGIIFQRPSLDLNLSGEENVRFHSILYGLYPFRPTYRLMPGAYRRQLQALASVVELDEDIFRPVKSYSGGMRRKLEIIRSLMHHPEVLFLDEPTVGLDPASRRNLWQYLSEERERSGTTVLLTTHYLDEAEGADRVAILNRGTIVSIGTTEDVKAALVHHYVVVDAEDRGALRAELLRLGTPWSGDGPYRLEVDGPSTHAVLRAISTPLTLVRTHTPTLEDAYLEVIGRTDEDEVSA
jgi:ABC-2 type transport system ATP-binding protein